MLDAFIRELPTITAGGAVLILDDFHLVDDAADVRHITRELLARAPERLTIVFASRRKPSVPLAKLRAVGEVAELGTGELRFDPSETARLFTETYGRRLDADVLADLAVRTEGWIASLQLVQAALRDRTPTEIRRFVRSLNGADHEMYDYLAEEVVGDLDEDLQRFLMETSILQVVTPDLAEVVRSGSGGGREAHDGGGTIDAPEPAVRWATDAPAVSPARARVPRGATSGDRRGGGGRGPASANRGRRRGNGLADRRVPLSRGGRHGRGPEGRRRRDPDDHGQGPVRPRRDLHRVDPDRDAAARLRPDPEPRRHAARRLRSRHRSLTGRPRLRHHRPRPARPRAAEPCDAVLQLWRWRPALSLAERLTSNRPESQVNRGGNHRDPSSEYRD